MVDFIIGSLSAEHCRANAEASVHQCDEIKRILQLPQYADRNPYGAYLHSETKEDGSKQFMVITDYMPPEGALKFRDMCQQYFECIKNHVLEGSSLPPGHQVSEVQLPRIIERIPCI